MADIQPTPPPDDLHPLDAYVNKKNVAMRHRDMVLGFLVTIIAFILYLSFAILTALLHLPSLTHIVAWLLVVAAHTYTVLQGFRLKFALGENAFFSLLFAVCLAIPVLNLAAIISVHNEAVRLLRRAGLRIGIIGVSERDYNRVYAPWLCLWCDYDLTGNRSGICSECGNRIPPDMLAVIAKRESTVTQTAAR